MERIEDKDARERWKLPKNVRQIGEPGTGMKILIEDYVYTFLHQMAESNLTCMKTAVLLGRVEKGAAVYIQGAVETDMGQEIRDWFSHEAWREIFQDIKSWFEGEEVVGWYMANPGFPPVLTEELKSLHMRNFSGEDHVFFQTDVLDREEVFYICKDRGLAPACGYYIYYEKNSPMQEYMSFKKGGASIEPEGVQRDRTAARFRNVMQEKREQNTQRKMLALLYTSCMFLVLVILVIGVTLVNNYDRMANMENALHQISESLEGEEVPEDAGEVSVEAAMEEENRLAAAETKEEEKAPEETPEEPVGEETPEEPVGEETPEAPAEEPEPVQTAEEPEAPEETKEVISQEVREPERYQVQVGDTLLEICRLRYGNDGMVREICELNGLEDGDKIYVGETILLP